MRFPSELHRATLLRRYKRFLADVVFEDGPLATGLQETVHVPNPGAMIGLSTPGMTVWTSLGGSKTRKLPHTLELVEADGGLVGINTLHPTASSRRRWRRARSPRLRATPACGAR